MAGYRRDLGHEGYCPRRDEKRDEEEGRRTTERTVGNRSGSGGARQAVGVGVVERGRGAKNGPQTYPPLPDARGLFDGVGVGLREVFPERQVYVRVSQVAAQNTRGREQENVRRCQTQPRERIRGYPSYSKEEDAPLAAPAWPPPHCTRIMGVLRELGGGVERASGSRPCPRGLVWCRRHPNTLMASEVELHFVDVPCKGR
ncbi:hypothetical protein B0H19DRAFT_1069686 [Mycena capillaripes]|nr:hypothetical protein B0H19DRAFT_1069686 [Mycena capillaripes]